MNFGKRKPEPRLKGQRIIMQTVMETPVMVFMKRNVPALARESKRVWSVAVPREKDNDPQQHADGSGRVRNKHLLREI